MNIDLLIQRLLGRATCKIASGGRIGRSARIRNAFGDSSRIRIGTKSVVLGELLTFGHGGEINIGEWCYIGEGVRIWSGLRIVIGDRVLIGHGVNIFDNLTHPIDADARHAQFRAIMESGHPKHIDLGDRPVEIQADAWVGAHAIILRGVTIGAKSIVAAGSVVTKDVPPHTIVAGNPAELVRAV